MVVVNWKDNLNFEAETPTGGRITMGAYPEEGETSPIPTPLQAFLASVAACSAIDVISILQKKRITVTSYRVEIDGDRVPEGQWPRPYTAIRVRHILSGQGLDEAAVARAVQLSDEKYCSISATLRAGPKVESLWIIE